MKSQNLPIAFLGTFLSNLNHEETLEAIFYFMEQYQKDLEARYVATVNVDFIVNANSINGKWVQDSELLNILRTASVATIDGMPIIWACRLLGIGSCSRVTGIDLFPDLLKKLEERKKSIFLLGGEERILNLSKFYLGTRYPNLKIAGSAYPQIVCKGEELASSLNRDALIVEQINEAKPDILFINLGNPKQELWFNRIKKILHVPISIGIGGTLDIFTETLSRAPSWMQKNGLEWLYRLIQEPRRLGKRYLKDIFQFPCMILPAIIYHKLNKLFAYFALASYRNCSIESRLFISSQNAISFTSLPHLVDVETVKDLMNALDDLFNQDVLVFDFSALRHLSLESIAFLLKLSQRAWKTNKPVYFINIKANVRKLIRLHGFQDILINHECDSLEELLNRMHQTKLNCEFYDSIQQGPQCVIISFFGRINSNIKQEDYLKKIKPMLEKNCILDFRYCTYIDQVGLALIIKIKKMQIEHQRGFEIRNPQEVIRKKLLQANII